MIKLNTHNSRCRVAPELVEVSEHLVKLEEKDQGFYKVIDDPVDHILDFAKSVKDKYDHIAVLGIGGSALGTICLKQALGHLYKPSKLHVLDNIDPALIAELDDVIDYRKTLFIVISKSGGTPETVSQYFYYRKKCDDKGLAAKNHFVFITGRKGLLRETSEKEGIKTFDIPENVGGRFSVLTSVGLLPAALIGIDIEALLEGARKMRESFLNKDFEKNLPARLAAIQYMHSFTEKRNINVIMPYSERLIRFADWYRQLLAESIGKKKDVGLTPVKALGVTDQHSQTQLYMDGPNDKLFIFIKVENLGPNLEIPVLDESVNYLKGVTFDKLMHTEMEGTIQALKHNERSSVTITVPEVNEKTLGELFMLFEGATAFLGEFYKINAFDQPGVELSKKLTKELLTKR